VWLQTGSDGVTDLEQIRMDVVVFDDFGGEGATVEKVTVG
jgi:hypothetical protein